MDFEICRPSALTPQDLASWRALQHADAALGTPFLDPGWALAVERAQAGMDDAGGRGVQVVTLRDGGRAVGFLSARVGRWAAMPAGSAMNDYQGLVGEAGLVFDPRRLVQALGVPRLDFTHVLGEQAWFDPFVRGMQTSYRVEAPDGYAAYAESHRAAAGTGVFKDIDKRRRKAERELGPVILSGGSASRDDFETLVAWKRRQYREAGQTDIFEAPWTGALLRDLFESPDPDFGGALFTLHIGGRLAAAQFNLRGREVLHAWIIAHDETIERYSPGLILFGEVLRWMDQTPFRTLDLGSGDYRFKLQLSNAQQQVAHGFVGRPSPATLLRSAEYRLRDTAERLPLGRVSALPGKAMRRLDLWRGLR